MNLNAFFKDAVSDNFLDEVAKYNIDGHYPARNYFTLSLTTTDTDIDFWEFGSRTITPRANKLTFQTIATDYYIASSSDTDTQDVNVYILDNSYLPKRVKIKLTGQTPVKINYGFQCMFGQKIDNISPTAFAGNIYCISGNNFTAGVPSSAADVRIFVAAGNNYSRQSYIVVPINHVLILRSSTAEIIKKQTVSADIRIITNSFNFQTLSYGVDKIQDTISLNTTSNPFVQKFFPTSLLLPPLSRLYFQCNASANDAGLSGDVTGEWVELKFALRASARIPEYFL